MYIPDLSPAAKINGLPEETQARLHNLLTKFTFDSGDWGNRQCYRFEFPPAPELADRHSPHALEARYLGELTAAGTKDKRCEIMAKQWGHRCKFVAEIMALHQQHETNKATADALVKELAELRKLVVNRTSEDPLMVLCVSLATIVCKFGRVDPGTAFVHFDTHQDLPAHIALLSVQKVFEELYYYRHGVPNNFMDGIMIPHIEIIDATGSDLALLEAIREAGEARQACKDSQFPQKGLAWERTKFINRMEADLISPGQSQFDQIKREMDEAEATIFAAAVECKIRHARLNAAWKHLTETAGAACDAIDVREGISHRNSNGILRLKRVINCIAAYQLIDTLTVEDNHYLSQRPDLYQIQLHSRQFIDAALAQLSPRQN